MGWALKHSDGRYISGHDGYDPEFSDDLNESWWWDTEEDARWFIEENGIEGVTPEDSNGSSPPGNGQPGKP
jgi:hypothetical protein